MLQMLQSEREEKEDKNSRERFEVKWFDEWKPIKYAAFDEISGFNLHKNNGYCHSIA